MMSSLSFTPRRLRFPLLTMLPLLAALGATPAHADDAAEIARLAQSGKGDEALKRIDAILSRQPADVQMRFMKGVMLSETRPAEAIAIFARLTQDHPKLPEPYNNLAVLYAAAGQYERQVYTLPKALDEKVAALHLAKVGAKLTRLTPQQAEYIGVPPSGPFKHDLYRY